jgi:hypothetical protein
MGNDIGVYIGGGGPGGNERPVDVEVGASASVVIAPGNQPLKASLDVTGTSMPLAANLTLQGTGADVAAQVTATVAPITAGVTASITQLPELGVRVQGIPPLRVTVPSEYTLGFSIFGFELFSFVLSSEIKARSV